MPEWLVAEGSVWDPLWDYPLGKVSHFVHSYVPFLGAEYMQWLVNVRTKGPEHIFSEGSFKFYISVWGWLWSNCIVVHFLVLPNSVLLSPPHLMNLGAFNKLPVHRYSLQVLFPGESDLRETSSKKKLCVYTHTQYILIISIYVFIIYILYLYM